MHDFRVIIQPEAQDDIIGYVDYLFFVKEVPETAMEIEAGIKDKIAGLSDNPQKYSLCPDPRLSDKGIHHCFFKNYQIFFLIDEQFYTVKILRVLHMLQDSGLNRFDQLL